MTQKLRIPCWDYDRVSALRDGRARVEGAEIEFSVLSPHGFFFRAGDAEFDVIERVRRRQMAFAPKARLAREPHRHSSF